MQTIRVSLAIPLSDNPLASVFGAAVPICTFSTEFMVGNDEEMRAAAITFKSATSAFADGMTEGDD